MLNGLPHWLSGKEPACNAEEPSSIPGLGRSPGGRHGNPIRYCCLENSMDRGAWQLPKSWTQLSDFHFSLLWKQLNTENAQLYMEPGRGLCKKWGALKLKLHAFYNITASVQGHGQSAHAALILFFSMFLFIYLAALGLSCSTQDLPSSSWHVGSSSETRDRTWVPC